MTILLWFTRVFTKTVVSTWYVPIRLFMDDPQHATIYVQVSFFYFFMHNFLFNLKLYIMVDAYMIYPFIFLNNFLMHTLGIIKFGNIVTRKKVVIQNTFSTRVKVDRGLTCSNFFETTTQRLHITRINLGDEKTNI